MLKTPLDQSLDFIPWAAFLFNPLAHMPNLVSSLAAKKDMFAKIWTNRGTINCLSRKLEKGEITRYKQFLIFPQCFKK